MEIGKRPDALRSGDATSLDRASGTKKSSETQSPQLPTSPGKPKPLADLLTDAKNALREPLPDIPHRILQTVLKERHLYVSHSEEISNFDLAAAALLNQKAPQAFIDRVTQSRAQTPKKTSLEPKHEEKIRLQTTENAKNMIQKIQSGKKLSQRKLSDYE